MENETLFLGGALTPEKKKRLLFQRQKELLDTFLEHGANNRPHKAG